MRLFALNIFTCLLMAFCGAAQAEVNGGMSKKLQQQGDEIFSPYADLFGFKNLVFAAENPPTLIYEYLPDGQTLDSWKYLATGTLIPMGLNHAQTVEFVNNYINKMVDAPMINLIEKQVVSSKNGNIAYMNYEIGDGQMKENNIALIWAVAPGVVANFQIQSRQGPYNEKTIGAFKKLLQNMKSAYEKK